jgi:hypothetical protein
VRPYAWQPGTGPDALALARMRNHFKRPDAPMGEAWFMGDSRHVFVELMGNLDSLSVGHLHQPFEEIASGTSSFGFLEEWNAWYHYLLAALLPRANEHRIGSLLEYFVTGFIAQHPHGIDEEPYQGFRNDALDTLGRCLMDGACWRDGDIVVGSILHRTNAWPSQNWGWWDASGDFSASLLFCLKYLPADSVAHWFRSVLAIPSPHWRAQLIVWLIGARDLLAGRIHWPADFSETNPRITWAWSHCLGPTLGRGAGDPLAGSSLIPEANRLAVLDVLQADVTASVYDEWLVSIMDIDYLVDELGTMPDEFFRLFVEGAGSGLT